MKADTVTSGIASQVACQVDLGDGRQFDIEYQGEDALWAATGPGIEAVDLWCKAVAAELDFRIRVIRTQSGIEVSIDRGQQEASWWPAEDAPRLIVAVDPDQKTVSISARVGRGADLREALLGKVSLGKQ